MSRKQKKRNKPYAGVDATPAKPTVRHYVAVQRSPLEEWWQARKKAIKIIAAIVATVLFVGYLLSRLYT